MPSSSSSVGRGPGSTSATPPRLLRSLPGPVDSDYESEKTYGWHRLIPSRSRVRAWLCLTGLAGFRAGVVEGSDCVPWVSGPHPGQVGS